MRVLLVEDEAPLRETLAARLKRDGVPASGHHIHPDAASYEIYLNTPMDTPKDKLHTELYLQLK